MKMRKVWSPLENLLVSIMVFIASVVLISGLIAWTGCGSARAGGYTAESFSGPNGTTCYVIMNGSTVVGGNCK